MWQPDPWSLLIGLLEGRFSTNLFHSQEVSPRENTHSLSCDLAEFSSQALTHEPVLPQPLVHVAVTAQLSYRVKSQDFKKNLKMHKHHRRRGWGGGLPGTMLPELGELPVQGLAL